MRPPNCSFSSYLLAGKRSLVFMVTTTKGYELFGIIRYFFALQINVDVQSFPHIVIHTVERKLKLLPRSSVAKTNLILNCFFQK